ncbi:MAG: hypothetical protein GTN71_00245 [Anaerolineae bacterium]|nr:hypothetical protein [Anaerolineae bacterium]
MTNDFTPWDAIPSQIVNIIEAQAKGPYQRDLLDGGESWSGASLAGKASNYGAVYARSRANLLARINDALPKGWRADTKLVSLMRHDQYGEPVGHRLCRELVVFGPDGQWLYGQYHN